MTNCINIKLTRHAERRMGQRGITHKFLDMLLTHADTETPVGGGLISLSVTSKRAKYLNVDDKLHRYCLLVSSDNALVSVLPMHGSQNKHYRRAV